MAKFQLPNCYKCEKLLQQVAIKNIVRKEEQKDKIK